MSDKISPEKLNEVKETTKEVLSEKARAEGKTTQQYYDELKEGARNQDPRALSTLNDLMNLIVITHQEKTILKSGMGELVSKFWNNPDADTKGNGKRFIKHYPVKPSDFDPNKFLPENAAASYSDLNQKVVFIKFKSDVTGQLEPTSKQKIWPIVYNEANLITYFISGQLPEFIAIQIKEHITESMTLYMYDLVMTALTKEQVVTGKNAGLIINGTQDKLFGALTLEFFPAVTEMLNNSSKYNVDLELTESIDASKKSDLLLLANPKLLTKIRANLESQLYNNAKIDIMDYVGQVHAVNNKIDFSGKTITTKNDEYYVDTQTLIVIDTKNFFQMIKMLEYTGGQNFPLNMAQLKVAHLWLASGYLPWGKRLIYKNTNI